MKVKMQNKWAWRFFILFALLLPFLTGCKQSTEDAEIAADLVLYNAFVYPVSGEPIEHGAVVIKDGKILTIGDSDKIIADWKSHSKEIKDCNGSFLMPGFIEG